MVLGGGPVPAGFVRRFVECVGLMMTADSKNRILRVHISGWVLDDRALPPPAVSDVIEVLLSFVASADSPSSHDESIRAIVRPLFGHRPGVHPEMGMRWPVELTGDGWSAGWQSHSPFAGSATLHGRFVADVGAGGSSDAVAVRGRVRRVQLMEHRQGVERLIDVQCTPRRFWSDDSEVTDDGFVGSGVLVELDLDDVPARSDPGFAPGSVATDGFDVWVMDRSNPVLVHIDMSAKPHRTAEYLLPMTIEPPTSGIARMVHADESACWITSSEDVFRCERSGDGRLTVERVAIPGGGGRIVDGRLVVTRTNRPTLVGDRRHGLIRKEADPNPVRIIDRNGTVTSVAAADQQAWLKDRSHTRNRPRVDNWRKAAADGVVVVVVPDGEDLRLDINDRAREKVEWIQHDAFEDPANAGLVPMISIDMIRQANRP